MLRKKLVKSRLPGSPDFVYPKKRIAIFVQGCFWHRCPVHGRTLPRTNAAFWRRKFERNVERDMLNRKELESMGWKVVEIWEHEVKADPRASAERVRREVMARMRPKS
jgi:DNA mismatch endonuclease, patch repair protein